LSQSRSLAMNCHRNWTRSERHAICRAILTGLYWRGYYVSGLFYTAFRLELIPLKGWVSHTDPSFPFLSVTSIGVDSGGSPGTRLPPLIKMGEKLLFCLPNNQTRICNVVIFYKTWKKAETETKKENTKKTEYILNEGCHFWKKLLLMTKKRSSEILENRRGFFQKLFRMLSENIFSKNCFAPVFVTQIFAPQSEKLYVRSIFVQGYFDGLPSSTWFSNYF